MATNATPSTPTPSTAIVATTANSPPGDGDNSDDNSDEELAKTMSSNLIDDDHVLFLEKECKTHGANRRKNTGAHEQRKIATKHRFFDTVISSCLSRQHQPNAVMEGNRIVVFTTSLVVKSPSTSATFSTSSCSCLE